MLDPKILIYTVLLLLKSQLLIAQEATPATGGDAVGPGGSSSYTVGQIVYTTNTGINHSEAQGIQQPYEITTVGIELPEITLNPLIHPNPTKSILYLNIKNRSNKLIYEIYNLKGELILHERINTDCTTIDMQNYAESIYILNVMKNKSLIKTFRIVKN